MPASRERIVQHLQTLGVLIAEAPYFKDEIQLIIDIGTNGEIVLAHDGKPMATSTAAGPAFEGARIRQGMRATTGDIEKVVVDGDVSDRRQRRTGLPYARGAL